MAVRNDTKRVEEVEEGVLCATILGYHAHNIKNMHHFCHAWCGHYNHFQFMWTTRYSDYQMSRKGTEAPKKKQALSFAYNVR
jgi:hypothetical protein